MFPVLAMSAIVILGFKCTLRMLDIVTMPIFFYMKRPYDGNQFLRSLQIKETLRNYGKRRAHQFHPATICQAIVMLGFKPKVRHLQRNEIGTNISSVIFFLQIYGKNTLRAKEMAMKNFSKICHFINQL